MKDKIEQYIVKIRNQTIIDTSIIGKTIQDSDSNKTQILDVGCDAEGMYITAKGTGRGYKIPESLFKHFRLID